MPGRLRPLDLFAQLTSEQLIVVAGRARLKRFRDGDLVITRGDDDKHDYFLIDGNVAVVDADGNSRLIASGSPQAGNPIAPLRPSPYDVRAIGPVMCAKMTRKEVALLREHMRRSQELHGSGAIEQSAGTRGLIDEIEADLAADRLKLPSLPDIALRIRGAISNVNCNNRHIADLLAGDPALAAKILKIANSPLCRGSSAVSNLQEAVMRIGWTTVSELVVCFSLKDLFRADSNELRERFAETASAAVRVGATATVIAARVAPRLGEQALVAGLLSNIGALPLLARASVDPAQVAEPGQLDDLLSQYSARIGELICRKWELGEDVTTAVMHAGAWDYVNDGAPDLAELVIVARYHTQIGGKLVRALPKLEAIHAMRILGDAPDPRASLDIIRDSKSRIDALLDALS